MHLTTITQPAFGAHHSLGQVTQSLTVNDNAFGVCNASTSLCQTGCHIHVVYVKPSTTYRVRTIGITALSFICRLVIHRALGPDNLTLVFVDMAIVDHPGFELIEVDSDYVSKHNAPHLEVHSGQRYSFLLKTKNVEELRALKKTVFWANMETRWRPTRDQGHGCSSIP